MWLDGYLGPLRRTLGIRVEEWAPLGSAVPWEPTATTTTLTGELAGGAHLWQDVVVPDDAEVLARFADGFAAGSPAVTKRGEGSGAAW